MHSAADTLGWQHPFHGLSRPRDGLRRPPVARAQAIAALARDALIEEPLVWPRFGLVGSCSHGAHRDMDYPLLVRSARVLEPYFADAVRLGAVDRSLSPVDTFELLRSRGRQAEAEMFRATRGVNTHKGCIFLFGLLLGSVAASPLWPAARVAARPSASGLLDSARRRAWPAIRAELASPHRGLSQTYGEWALERHGWRGVRGVVENGFLLIRRGLGHYLRHRSRDRWLVLGQLRHFFVSHSEDTNLLRRAGLDTAHVLRQRARALLRRGGIATPEGQRGVVELEGYMLRCGLSAAAGGDLLACSLLLIKLMEHGYVASA